VAGCHSKTFGPKMRQKATIKGTKTRRDINFALPPAIEGEIAGCAGNRRSRPPTGCSAGDTRAAVPIVRRHAGLPCCRVPMFCLDKPSARRRRQLRRDRRVRLILDSTASPAHGKGPVAGRHTNCAEGGRLRRNIDIGKGKIRVMSETNWTANWARRARITDGPAGYVIAGMRRDPNVPPQPGAIRGGTSRVMVLFASDEMAISTPLRVPGADLLVIRTPAGRSVCAGGPQGAWHSPMPHTPPPQPYGLGMGASHHQGLDDRPSHMSQGCGSCGAMAVQARAPVP
jgi:hypothetical protein